MASLPLCFDFRRRVRNAPPSPTRRSSDLERRAREAGLSWPLPAHLDDEALEVLLYPPSSTLPLELRPEPNYALIDRQLALKGVTRQLLWLEYKSGCAGAYEYSRFCQGLREWRDQRGLSMRQTHLAGEKVFVDYAGQTMPVIDPESGEVRQASIFVAALGASHYTYVEATWGQGDRKSTRLNSSHVAI